MPAMYETERKSNNSVVYVRNSGHKKKEKFVKQKYKIAQKQNPENIIMCA